MYPQAPTCDTVRAIRGDTASIVRDSSHALGEVPGRRQHVHEHGSRTMQVKWRSVNAIELTVYHIYGCLLRYLR